MSTRLAEEPKASQASNRPTMEKARHSEECLAGGSHGGGRENLLDREVAAVGRPARHDPARKVELETLRDRRFLERLASRGEQSRELPGRSEDPCRLAVHPEHDEE